MAYFKDMEDFKKRAFFFPKGRIIPKWLLQFRYKKNNVPLRQRHLITFGVDTWVIAVDNRIRFILFATTGENEYVVRIGASWDRWMRITADYRDHSKQNFFLNANDPEKAIALANEEVAKLMAMKNIS